MKTYEEKTQSVFQRIEEETAIRKRRSRVVRRAAAPVLSLCLVAVIGLGAWHAGVFEKAPERAFSGEPEVGLPIPNPDGTIVREPMPEVIPTHPILRPGDEGYIAPIEPIREPPESDIAGEPTHTADAPTVPNEAEPPTPEVITGVDDGQKGGGPDVTGGFCQFWWKNKLLMSGDLYWALDENPGGTFAVMATYRPATANITDFTYEGKTLSEWAIAADEERLLPDKMTQLLKCGDELKYGPALYETGTPDGIKWDRSWYENQVAFFGELLDKYIVDGEFLRAELEADIAALQSISITTPDGMTTMIYYGETSARKQYSLAYNAYLDTVLPAAAEKLTANGIPCQRAPYRSDALSFAATAVQLESLPLDDLASWTFSLNSGDLKAAPGIVTDGTGLQVVN